MAAPIVTDLTITGVEDVRAVLSFSVAGEGIYSAVILPAEDDAPDAEEVLSGPTFEVSGTVKGSIPMGSLQPGVTYIAYVATSDDAEEDPDVDVVASSTFTTLKSIPNPVMHQQNTPRFLRTVISA